MNSQTLVDLYSSLAWVVAQARAMGATRAVLSPGSRSVPLAYTIIKSGLFQVYHLADERSAAYFALGLAKASQEPVILVCTSGTAAYNYAPGVSEAFFQHIPLWVWTADRPPEAIGQFENQAIFQENLFGRHVRYFGQMPVDHAGDHNVRLVRNHIYGALQASRHPIPGPIHLNFPFREPFYPSADMLSASSHISGHGPVDNEPALKLDFSKYHALFTKIMAQGRLWVLAGMGHYGTCTEPLAQVAALPGVTLLTDPLSNIRVPHAWNGYDNEIKRKEVVPPQAVISFGNQFLSKNLIEYLRDNKPEVHCHVQSHLDMGDPFGSISQRIISPLDNFLQWFVPMALSLKSSIEVTQRHHPTSCHLDHDPEMAVAGLILSSLPRGCVLHLANSTPVRYLLAHQSIISDAETLAFANRGTSGIDGCVSTACGMAAAWPHRDHVLIVGDMAMVYDSNALWNAYITDNLKIILINNKGGGIFKRIRKEGVISGLETYFSPGPDVRYHHLAAAYGFGFSSMWHGDVTVQALAQWFGNKQRAILEIEIV